MNDIYLIIMLTVMVLTVVVWSFFDDLMDYFLGFLSIWLLSIGSILMLVLSLTGPVGKDIVKIYSATNTKIGNELIIQADGVPTQVITDIKFIDAPVQIKRTIQQNAWGCDMNTIYEVELIKTEIQSQP